SKTNSRNRKLLHDVAPSPSFPEMSLLNIFTVSGNLRLWPRRHSGQHSHHRALLGCGLVWSNVKFCVMEATYAYLAGALDIDGFISIRRRILKSRGGPAGSHYCARIGLSDASPIVPELLHSIFPGTLARSHPKKPSYTAFYMWEVEGQKAREPLVRLLPHLRLKRRHAELALELIDLMEKQN